jgi:hypothetical protein
LYLGGTDAPFEAFAGLWGCTFFIQIYQFTPTAAAAATTIIVILSTISQLIVPFLQQYYTKQTSRLYILTVLALLGCVSFLPFLLVPVNTFFSTHFVGYTSSILLGFSVASCTVIWSLISSDKVCNGVQSTGLISGAVNTLCIAYDAFLQQMVGVVLAWNWNGKMSPVTKERVYSAEAFSYAFSILAGSFLMAAACSTLAATGWREEQSCER